MATIQEDILETFFEKLAQSDGFTNDSVKQLRALIVVGKPVKTADLVSTLSGGSQEPLP